MIRAMDLPELAVYAPFASGRYSVLPGLSRLGTDFGNADLDARLFQIDIDWSRFHKSKSASIAERADKYLCASEFEDGTRRAVARFMAERLSDEWPRLFALQANNRQGFVLTCRLSDETLQFDLRGDLVSHPDLYADGFDALCRQVQEDVAIVRRDAATGDDFLTALHVCHPSRWVPEEKIGRSFATVHGPVPSMERTIGASASVVRAMVLGPPCVRFVWMVEPTDRLNRHPDAPPDADPMDWNARGMDCRTDPPFFVRVERQTFCGLPNADAALFAIRLYHLPANVVLENPLWRRGLRDALAGMNADARAYKGLDDGMMGALLSYLSAR